MQGANKMATYTEKERLNRCAAVKRSKEKMKREGFVIVGVKVPTEKRMLIKDIARELCKKGPVDFGSWST